LKKYKSVQSGFGHNCAVSIDVNNDYIISETPPPPGSLRCWGLNQNGQTDIPSNLGNLASNSSLGYAHTCTIYIDDDILCWGINTGGQTDVPAIYQAQIEKMGMDTQERKKSKSLFTDILKRISTL